MEKIKQLTKQYSTEIFKSVLFIFNTAIVLGYISNALLTMIIIATIIYDSHKLLHNNKKFMESHIKKMILIFTVIIIDFIIVSIFNNTIINALSNICKTIIMNFQTRLIPLYDMHFVRVFDNAETFIKTNINALLESNNVQKKDA
jgi:hypothetical protein